MWLIFQPYHGIILLIVLISTQSTYAVVDDDHLEYAPQYEHPEYAFSYGVKDLHTGDVKSQWESRDGGVIKGHYSVREPDGSIRTVDYTADAKNGFNAVVKTHGPNSHPVTDTPHSEYAKNDDTSQSKINHYSKDQEHIVLSSDLHPVKRPIDDISHTHPKTPSLIELRPYARIKQIPMESIRDSINPYRSEHDIEKKYFKEIEPEIKSVKPPDLTKYKRVSPFDFYDTEDTEDWKAIPNEDVINFYESTKPIISNNNNNNKNVNNNNKNINNNNNNNNNNNHHNQKYNNNKNTNNNNYNNNNNNNNNHNNSNKFKNKNKNENLNHYNKNYYRDYEKLQQHQQQQQQFQEDYFQHRKFNYKGQQLPQPESYPSKPAQVSSLRTDFISSKPYQDNRNLKRPNFSIPPEIPPPKKNFNNYQNPSSLGLKHFSAPKKNYNSKRHKNVDYSSYFQRQGKSRPITNGNNKEGPVVFPNEDEYELREAASAGIVQSMLHKDKKHMVPGYASLIADRYFGA